MNNEDKYISYFRHYRDESAQDFDWWYCIIDDEVYSTDDIYLNFNYSSKSEIIATNSFIEFDKVDIIELKRDYYQKRFGKLEYNKISMLPDSSFDIEFNKFVESNNLIKDWYQYERTVLQNAFNDWCKINKVIIG